MNAQELFFVHVEQPYEDVNKKKYEIMKEKKRKR